MVHRETDFPNSRAPTRSEQLHCRHRVQNCERQLQLDDSSSFVLPDQQEIQHAGSGSICILADPPTGLLLQLEAAEATDAFTQTWSQFQGYANPPWCLLLPTLAKIQREKAKVVGVAPLWRTQPWYPLLLQFLIKTPLLIPTQENMVILPTQQFIMPAGVPQLVAWPLTGISGDQEVF